MRKPNKTQPASGQTIRKLRCILDKTQVEFAAMVGVSKDAVASWEINRNGLSKTYAARIAFATGADAESLLSGAAVPTVTVPVLGARPYTAEDFARYQKTTKGRTDEAGARYHVQQCEDALGLIFLAAGRDTKSRQHRLPGLLDSFMRWCERAREDFQLGAGIEDQLIERKSKAGVTLSYGEWRAAAREEPERMRAIGFRDDAEKGDREMLRLEMEVKPGWAPGLRMKFPNVSKLEVVWPKGVRGKKKTAKRFGNV